MEGLVKGMAGKRERHFNESKTVLSVALMLFGAVACFCLVMIWPQSYMIKVFNSKMTYHLIMDIEDYFTCNKEYIGFVIDEPDPSYSMYTIFVFNVTNPADVLERGNKPEIVETGPYGFVKYTYKYDISFDDPEKSTTVTYKEFSILQTVDDADACEKMYFRMDRDLLQAEPCANGACQCKAYDSLVTIINPLLLKIIHDEGTSEIIAQHGVEIFSEIKTVLEDPFTEAVRAHMVPRAFKEVFLFRTQSQAGVLVRAAVISLLQTYTLNQIANTNFGASSCGMAPYGITGCPFQPYATIQTAKTGDIPSASYPSVAPLLNASNSLSILHLDTGFPRLLGVAWALELVEFNSLNGYSSVTRQEMLEENDVLVDFLATSAFGSSYDANQKLGSQRMLTALAKFIVKAYLTDRTAKMQSMAYDEFLNGYDIVPCNALAETCLWQYGYLKQYRGMKQTLGLTLAKQLIDLTTETSTNPANLYKDKNAPKWYNAYLYCTDVQTYEAEYDISCTDLPYTYNDGRLAQPAALWGKDTERITDNLTQLAVDFQTQPISLQNDYYHLSCNISVLLHDVYRNSTDFHDHFVVRFLNKYKDPNFSHNFTVGNWNDLGIAQWGGGFVTFALVNVRSIYQMVRDGMWRIGKENFNEAQIEYGAWAAKQGFPHAWIHSVDDARTLLHALARRDSIGVALRRHIAYQSTTYIGDGKDFIRGVGNIGDRTFITEANKNSFACDGENQKPCSLMDVFYNSSYEQCQVIQSLYETCVTRFTLDNIKWIDLDHCEGFETSETSETQGILCDVSGIYSNPHPYRKSIGNIVYRMMWALVVDLELLDGLWCSALDTCAFLDGGMFATTSVRKLLFEGYTEPSVLKFLDLKYDESGIGFECEDDPFDTCGKKQYKCMSPGVMLTLPSGDKKLLRYENTSNEEYFAPYFVVTNESELLWPYAIDPDVAMYAQEKMELVNYTKVTNPHFAVYPAWTANDTAFNKHYQCQKRFLGGTPHLFNSCFDTLYTGRDNIDKTLRIQTLHGNDTIYPFVPEYVLDATSSEYVLQNSTNSISVTGSSVNNQHAPELWTGFQAYPYNYQGLTGGVNYDAMTAPTVFDKHHGMTFTLYQKSLIFEFQRQLTVSMPLKISQFNTFSPMHTLPARRFVEDTDTWAPYRTMGVPRDSYGMPYVIPLGMASLERYAAFPIFTSTPHMYGNMEWGGIEFNLVIGTSPAKETHRTYVDYDPVTGRALRNAIRQQINIRVEANAMFPNAFSSQQRCIVPTRFFAASSGFGCFTYVPLLWFEDARTVDTETFFRFYDHYYSRPERAATLTLVGIAFGSFFLVLGACIFVNEAYHRRKFNSRVYVD